MTSTRLDTPVLLSFLSLSLAVACGDASVSEDRLKALEERNSEIDELRDEVSQLREELSNCLGAGSLEGYVTESSLSATLDAYATTTGTDALDARLAEVEDSYVSEDALFAMDYASQSSVDALADRISAVESGLATVEADYVPEADIGDVVRLIDEDWSLPFKSEVDLREALASLDGYRIAHDATVTFTLEAGAWNFTEPLELAHPDGGRIQIIGAGTDATLLYFTGSDGIVVHENSAIGLIADLKLMGDGTGHDGLRVTEGASVTVGNLEVEDFGGAGVLVEANASLLSEGAQEVSGCGSGFQVQYSGYAEVDAVSTMNEDYGFYAYAGGVLLAEGAVEEGGSLSYHGYLANLGGILLAEGSSSNGNLGNGYSAHGAVLNARDTSSTGNDRGYYATQLGFLYAPLSDASGNTTQDYFASRNGFINAEAATASSACSIANFEAYTTGSIWAYTANVTGGRYNYKTLNNGYIYADGVAGGTEIQSSSHDTTDFIIGLD